MEPGTTGGLLEQGQCSPFSEEFLAGVTRPIGAADGRLRRTNHQGIIGTNDQTLASKRSTMAEIFPDTFKPLEVGAVHHVAINVRDLAKSGAFYTKLLGLRRTRQTIFRQVLARGAVSIHLFQVPEPATAATPRNWRQLGLQHIAFGMPEADMEAVKDRLTRHGIPADGPLDDEDGRGLYLRDPDGNIIELRTPQAPPVREAPSPRPQT